MPKKIEFTESSGNVFADLGLANADELLAKAEMALNSARLLAVRTTRVGGITVKRAK